MSLSQLIRAAVLAAATFATLAPSASFAQAASAPEAAAAPAAPTTPAPAPAAPPAAEPAVTTETVENPYGLEAMWRQGDWVSKGTLIILIIMSMGSWYIIFTKLFEQSKLMRSAKAASANFWNAGSIRKGADALDDKSALSPRPA
jgi:biopolymer transport protein ExbB